MRAPLSSEGGILSSLDRLVICGLAALVVATPIAIGSVNRGAEVAMEITIFGLAVLWIARSAIGGIAVEPNPLLRREAWRLALGLMAMAVLLLIQLIPMPPQILRLLSPKTYQVYQIAFPGWPYTRRLATPGPAFSAKALLRPSRAGTNLTFSPQTPAQHPSATAPASTIDPLSQRGWRPLTLSPAVTVGSLLEFLTLGMLFFLVLLYPFAADREGSTQSGFVRDMIYLVVATAALVALLGIAGHVWWNGKILWFYQPADWTGPSPAASPRASGPFVNPDHFANYLAMVLPLATAGALFPLAIMRRRHLPNGRMLCGGAAVLILVAIALSLSRGGGLAICAGVMSMMAISFRRAPECAPTILRRLGLGAMPLSILTLALMAGLTFYLIGSPARSAVGMRLAATSADDFSARVGAWHETLTMVGEFPLFGVGAGGWPGIFPHYQPPPESRYYFFRTAEDDYLQFVAENGISGLIILLVIATLVIRALAAGTGRMPTGRWPLLAGLLGGLAGGLAQESVDSSLHIPANALLFTIVLALMLRVALEPTEKPQQLKAAVQPAHRSTLPLLLAPAAVILIIAACKQDGRAYPYMLGHSADLTAAVHNVIEHPAMSAAHLALAQMLPSEAVELQREQLSAAVWLDPNEALARDLFARDLLMAGRKAEALGQLSISVYRAPFLELHYYLAPSAIAWLLPEEQEAIARGFERAIDGDFANAADQLASFYMALGRERDAARAYERAALVTPDKLRRLEFLLRAGQDYTRLHEYTNGGRVLLSACDIAPDDPRAYAELAQNIYGPEDKLAAATAIISQGIRAGADPYVLELALADAAEMNGRHQIAETALARALDYAPSFDATLALGRIYFADERFGRAVVTLQQAVELNPKSAEAFMWLGRAHQANYDYYEAASAYRHAMSLAPGDKDLRDQYRQFQQRSAGGEAN
jgi:tetratricopeptide (TPR) repeat protein